MSFERGWIETGVDGVCLCKGLLRSWCQLKMLRVRERQLCWRHCGKVWGGVIERQMRGTERERGRERKRGIVRKLAVLNESHLMRSKVSK